MVIDTRRVPARSRARAAGVIGALAGAAVLAVAGSTQAAPVHAAAAHRSVSTTTAYTTNLASRTLTETDTATGSITKTVDLDLPHGIGVDPEFDVTSPDGRMIYVEDAIGGDISVVDPATRKATAVFHVCFGPDSVSPLVFTSDSSKAYIVCGRALYDIDTATRTSAKVAAVSGVNGIAASPDKADLYVTSGDSLLVLDTATDAVAATIPIGTSTTPDKPLVVSPDGSRVFVALATGVAVLDTGSDSPVTTVPIANGALALALTSDGTMLAVAPADMTTPGALDLISTATDTITGTVPLGSIEGVAKLVAVPHHGSDMFIETFFEGSDGVTAYDIDKVDLATSTVTVVDTLSSESYFLDVLGDGSTVYASPSLTNELLAISVAVPSVIVRTTLVVNQGDIAFSADNDLAFVVSGSYDGRSAPGQMWVIQTGNGARVGSIEPERQIPGTVVVTPNGDTAYVAGTTDIIAIDTATGAKTAIPLKFGGPAALALSPDGGTLYATNSVSSDIYSVSTATDRITATHSVPDGWGANGVMGYRAMAMSRDGSKLYVADAAGLSVVDAATDAVIGKIATSGTPSVIAVSPNGTEAYVGLRKSGLADSIAIIDTVHGSVSGTIALAPTDWGIAFTPDGTKAYVTTDNGDTVSVVDTATATVRGTVTVGSNPESVVVSPDGAKAFVANMDGGGISVIDTATDTVTGSLTAGNEPVCVAVGAGGPPSAG